MSELSEFLDKELADWRKKEEADVKNIVVTNGGTCEVLFLIDNIQSINRDWLLKRHKEIKGRKNTTKLYDLMVTTMERDKCRLKVIVSVGTKLKEMLHSATE